MLAACQGSSPTTPPLTVRSSVSRRARRSPWSLLNGRGSADLIGCVGRSVRLPTSRSAVESLHNRAATLIFGSSFASSLLGSRALADGLGVWDWLAILLLAIGALAVVLLWPCYNLSFRFDAQDLLDTYIDSQTPATMAGMYRDLALRIKADWHRNGRIVRRLREAFQLALVLLLNILAWLFSIAGSPT
jgi:hypothetical protein